jgi:hypothetical protein
VFVINGNIWLSQFKVTAQSVFILIWGKFGFELLVNSGGQDGSVGIATGYGLDD